MYKATVFIISKRKELSIKYKKLIEALEQEVLVISSLSAALEKMQKIEPELILISDTIDEKLSDFCPKIRALTFNVRPIIVAISKSDELIDRLEVFESGADDFMSESISSLEFQTRIKAHLRRYFENLYNPSTLFAQRNLTIRALKKLIYLQKKCAIIFVKISNISNYREIYGEIAYQKVLQTLSALINSVIVQKDFAGHFFDDEFIIITDFAKAEKIAPFLAFAFDNILCRFYTKGDFENNFTLLSSDIKEEKKEALMRLNACVLENDKDKFSSYEQIITSLFELMKSCKNDEKSTFVIDRPKLYGKVEKKEPKNKVMIMEEDEALSILLETLCILNSFEVRVCSNYAQFRNEFDEFMPDVVVMDYGQKDLKDGLKLSYEIKKIKNANTKIILSSSVHNKKEILASGADFYLPKPYDTDVALLWIKRFLND